MSFFAKNWGEGGAAAGPNMPDARLNPNHVGGGEGGQVREDWEFGEARSPNG